MAGQADRERFSAATDQLDAATDDLIQSNAILNDTIGLEMEAIGELQRQDTVLRGASRKMDSIDGELDKGRSILQRMSTRACLIKMALVGFAVILGLAILVTIIVVCCVKFGKD